MLALQSDLRINTLYIIKSSCELIVPKEEIDPGRIFQSYPIEIDYTVKEQTRNKTFRVLLDIKINYPGKDPGYSIVAEAMGNFTIQNSEKLTPSDIHHLMYFTAIERCIEYIRGYVATVTSQYPLGKYIFQGINMELLYQEKIEHLKKIKPFYGDHKVVSG